METQLNEASSDNSKDHTATACFQDPYGNVVKQPSCNDYHVAWICPVADIELLPARLMLDKELPTPKYNTHYDENTYICGTINGHAVVIATCPPGETGNVNAGRLTGSMFKTFPDIRMAVLVGIGGGIPRPNVPENPLDDVHLGDVVVGWPGDGKPACVYHDRGRLKVDGQFEMVGTMQNPDWRLTNALGVLVSDHKLRRTKFHDQLARLRDFDEFTQPALDQDRLFKAVYCHVGQYGSNCAACDQNELVQRPQRTEDNKNKFVFHLGRIATGNAVIQNGEERDRIRTKCDGALCVEMEAAGVDINRRCLVIRGISDYADSHKNDAWRSHAAGNAAAFTRELLCRIQPATVERMEIEAPWLVPFVRTPSFAGRDDQLAQLSHHISSDDSQRLAIYGLGGCGKTALALESAYRTREQLPTRAIFWVPVISRETVEQAYREIATLLRIPGIAGGKADVKRLVKAKLSEEGFGKWLMIVDNADDVSVLFDPPEIDNAADPLIDYLPHSRKGSIIFTTRTRAAAVDLAGSNVIELGELNALEAKELLRTRLLPNHQHQLEDDNIVDEFLHILAFLALAIVQAVAFINKANTTLSDYIAVYRDREKDAIDLLSKEFQDQGRHRNTKNPVATTWYISFEQIQKQNTLAAEYLYFMACTTGENIPASLLLTGSTKLATMEAIGVLDAYAFATERRDQQNAKEQQYQERVFDIHRLVRLATRKWLREHSLWDIWADRALARLVDVIPFGDHDTREVWTAYLPHAIHIAGLPEVYKSEARMLLLDRIGRCEQTLGRYRAAEQTQRQLLEQREKVSGKEHADTLTNMNELALALSNQGKYAEAEKMHRETLELDEKVSGKEHPATLTSMSNVALALSNQGKYAEAEKMHRETLELDSKVSGKEHPHTLTSMSNVALALSKQGKYAEAEKMHRETLELDEKVSGKEHPDTLTSMSYLANALSSQGKYAEAEKMHRETLALRVKVSGKEHPATLTSMSNLAFALSNQGKYAEAEKMHRETLELDEKVSGKEHPDTLTSMNNLALALSNQGKYAEAEKMDRETLVLRVKVSGKEHPDTLTSMSNVAQALSNQGKYAEAEKMHRETLVLRVKVSGKEHPATLTSMGNVALALSNQGKYAEAEKMHRETLVLRVKVSGKEHPATLTSMSNLANALSSQGKYAEAEKMDRETLALRVKVLGKEHPDTLTSMSNVALALSDQGKYAEAEKMHRETLVLRVKVSGKEHPATLTSMSNLANALSSQGKYAEAEKMDRETLALRVKVLGKEHPDTLTSMSNVALALSDQGKYAEAEKMHRETLVLRVKVSGKEHPATLTSMSNVALALSNQGKYAEAEKMHRETLELDSKVSGKEHPHTLTSMSNVALALSKQGKYAEAEKMHRETLELDEKVSGKEHPDTLTSMSYLANALSSQGKYAEAEKMHRETLALRVKVSGKEHPATLTSMSYLANALSSQGKYAEAEKMDRETLALRVKVLGKEHPDTLTSMSNVAQALSNQGKYAEAEKMHRETLVLRVKVSGKEHPDTLTSMSNLELALSKQGM